jgi:hypothetical protein
LGGVVGVLGFELRALSLLGRCSSTPIPFCFSYVSGGVSHFGLGWPLTTALLPVPGVTVEHHHAWLVY